MLRGIMRDETLHKLRERVKELTALHGAARILQDLARPPRDVIRAVLALLPPAWQYPEVTAARIRFGALEETTAGYRATAWRQVAPFPAAGGEAGEIEICYLEERPPEDEGPFLREERDLIESLAEMLGSHFQRRRADEALRDAHAGLEREVAERTAALRRLASELSLAEARERKRIAEDLHDHIGQALAFIKMNLGRLRGNAIFCGFESQMDEIAALLDQTIRYTRSLTFEISPPVLYDLGLAAAVDALAERFGRERGLAVEAQAADGLDPIRDEVKVLLYKSVQELLANVVKHAGARRATVRLAREGDSVRVEVSDDGRGFETSSLQRNDPGDRFGLFNIRERVGYLGGEMEIRSRPGQGTTIVLRVPAGGRGE
jgi:two-component system, NarL family, sensor kinase